MAVIYNQATQNARLTAVRDQIDAHASPAKLDIYTSAYGTLLVSITLSADPSFSVSGSTPATKLGMNGLPKSGTAVGAGAAAIARITDGGGTAVVSDLSVTATGGGGNIQLNATTIAIGQTVTIQTTAEIVHPG